MAVATHHQCRISAVVGLPIASGTNVDDLSDYRPGLDAARRYRVFHPFVEAGVRKRDIYAMANEFGLYDLASLPAQPCLSSRIETGIAISEQALGFIEEAEKRLSEWLGDAGSIRCRVTAAGVFVECERLPEQDSWRRAEQGMAQLCATSGRQFAGIRAYRRGAAFLREAAQ